MSETVTLDDVCAKCGKEIAIVFKPADVAASYADPKSQPWACPHGCGWTERPEHLHGTIKEVRVRRPPDA